MRQVYLDHQTTTPLLPEVFEAMQPYFKEAFGSPSSLHQHGLRAREALDRARQQIASLIHAESPENILFTSNGTEALNLAVKGSAYANQRRGRHIVLSATEHPAVINSVRFLETQGFTSTLVPVDAAGRVDPEAVRAAIQDDTVLVAVHHVNHEIGTIEPIEEIGRVTAERGIPLLVDALAGGGWLPVDVQSMGAGLVALSPHRFYGPKGVGVLYRHRRARLTSLLHGSTQEDGRRAGMENVPAIVGAGVAAEIAQQQFEPRQQHTGGLQRRLWEGLNRNIENLQLNGPPPGPERIPTNLNISSEFVEGEGQLLLCDTKGIAVASGSNCVSKAVKNSHVLEAIGLDPGLAQGHVIFSVGQENTEEEIDYVIDTFAQVVAKLRGMSPLWDEYQRGVVSSAIGTESLSATRASSSRD